MPSQSEPFRDARVDAGRGRRENPPMATTEGDELLSVEFFAGHVGEHFDIRIEGRDPYRLEHPRLAPLEIFLVPLGPEPGGDGAPLYEATFS